jgi:ATP-dependent helicase Lhr and Lhr-like helicase
VQILQMLAQCGALFFGELLKTRSLLPSRAEQALAEQATQGWVTADSLEGTRALLLPP